MHDLATRLLRRTRPVGVRVARRALLGASGAASRAADPARTAWWLLRGARDRSASAVRAVTLIDGLVPPGAADVVGAYLRGRVLLGVPNSPDVRFEYLRTDERSIITPESKHVPKRLRALERKLGLTVRVDDDFDAVVQACRRADFTWITDEVAEVYGELFRRGLASCISVHEGDRMVGGLWGIALGRAFGVMSVFHRADHAGSMAQLAMLDQLSAGGRWSLIEVGAPRPHYDRLGAFTVSADAFPAKLLDVVGPSLASPTPAPAPA